MSLIKTSGHQLTHDTYQEKQKSTERVLAESNIDAQQIAPLVDGP